MAELDDPGTVSLLGQEVAQDRHDAQPRRPQATRYRSVSGVGSLIAAMRVAFLPAWGQRDSKALTSRVGLAPWSRDSGHKRGQRAIRDDPAAVRQALYMTALSVIRQEGIHQHFHQGLRQRGKTGKVALIAVMRKLLLHLNTVALDGPPWFATGEVAIGTFNVLTDNQHTRCCCAARLRPRAVSAARRNQADWNDGYLLKVLSNWNAIALSPRATSGFG